MKNRVVILGGNGFIGSAIANSLQEEFSDIKILTSRDCNLLEKKSISILNDKIKDGDVFVFAAAKAPAKNWNMFEENMNMVNNLILGLQDKKISYFLNISSDAIYSDSDTKIGENSLDIPDNPHGFMHFVRESLINKNINSAIGHIRPTLVFGKDDPHNGYGPNMFLRLAKKQQNITLFGGGEERRDHVHVRDVAKIAHLMIKNKISSNVNAVSGSPITFMEIAQYIKEQIKYEIDIVTTKRNGPMPHNGLRVFEKSRIIELYPDFKFLGLKEYIKMELDS
jgi:nucleoside-diphosphate-sugar epimerase